MFERRKGLDLDKCCVGERVLSGTYEVMDTYPIYAMSEVLDKIGFFDLVEHNYQRVRDQDPKGEVGDHLRFSLLSRQILTREEFDRRFNSNPCLKERWRETIWQHMTHCAVFFLNTYREVMDSIDSIKNFDLDPESIFKLLKILHTTLKVIEDYRKNHAFCEGCEYDNPILCEFWRRVALDIQKLRDDSDPETTVLKIKGYLQHFNAECRIPKVPKKSSK